MLKQLVFRLILAAFGFILVPTDYWHSCEKAHTEHSDHQTSIDGQHQSCSICDFDLFQLDKPEFFKFKSQRAPLAVFSQGKTNAGQSAAQSHFNKGPPEVAA